MWRVAMWARERIALLSPVAAVATDIHTYYKLNRIQLSKHNAHIRIWLRSLFCFVVFFFNFIFPSAFCSVVLHTRGAQITARRYRTKKNNEMCVAMKINPNISRNDSDRLIGSLEWSAWNELCVAFFLHKWEIIRTNVVSNNNHGIFPLFISTKEATLQSPTDFDGCVYRNFYLNFTYGKINKDKNNASQSEQKL